MTIHSRAYIQQSCPAWDAAHPGDLQRLNAAGSLYVTRPFIGHYIATPEELAWRAEELFSAVSGGHLDIEVGLSLPLEQAAEAHWALEGRETTGKVVLTA